MRVNSTAAVTLAFLLIAAPRVEAQASLDAARELYASAEYEDALTMLNGLLNADHSGDERRTLEVYRVLCLVATGRESAANGAIEELVARNPLYKPTDDLPPRVRATFNDARKRLLPSAVQTTYQEAKAAFDFKDYATASRGFAQVLQVLADPEMAVQASQSPLKDIRMLATGFHELSLKALVPAEPVAVAAAPPAPIAPEPPPVARARRVYSAEDRNVVPPIVVSQRIPSFPGPIRVAHTGVIEVLIDDTGSVESATMFAPISPQYDRLALSAARAWQYEPARLDGVPVKFMKRIQVNIVPTNSND